jgi:hypothetical protein
VWDAYSDDLLKLIGLVIALGAVVKVKGVQWVWSRLVAEPTVLLVRRAVEPMITDLDARNTVQHETSQTRQDERHTATIGRIEALEQRADARFDRVEERLDAVESAITKEHT